MDAYVKLLNIDTPILIPAYQKIVSISKDSGQVKEISDTSSYRFEAGNYYIFKGNSVLHVDGSRIEYVFFQQ